MSNFSAKIERRDPSPTESMKKRNKYKSPSSLETIHEEWLTIMKKEVNSKVAQPLPSAYPIRKKNNRHSPFLKRGEFKAPIDMSRIVSTG